MIAAPIVCCVASTALDGSEFCGFLREGVETYVKARNRIAQKQTPKRPPDALSFDPLSLWCVRARDRLGFRFA